MAAQGLVAPPELSTAVAADWEAALDRAERGEALPVPSTGAAEPAAAVMDEDAEAAALASPLPPQRDCHGETMDEAQQLEIGTYGCWWDEGLQQWLTNWPAPEGWAGQWFMLDVLGEAEPLVEDADDGESGSEGEDDGDEEPGPLARSLAPEELAAQASAAGQADALRAQRTELYRRAAFGLASAAECASIMAANPGGWSFAPLAERVREGGSFSAPGTL